MIEPAGGRIGLPLTRDGLRHDEMSQEYRRRLRGAWLAIASIAVIVAIGVSGYMLLEGWSAGDSLYMVIITLSTVGFREVRPLSPGGQYLTIFLILTGVAAFASVAANFAKMAIEGELRRVVGRRRMDKEIARMTGHFIICGFGRVGRTVARNLRSEGVAVVVVDKDAEALEVLRPDGVPFVRGDAVDETILLAAGIQRARGVLLTLSHEADNVYVTLLAKDLRRDLLVVARSISDQGERRLLAAGADRVVSPERIGAQSMSNSVLRPTVVDFAEVATGHENLELQLEEQRLGEGSSFIGNSISECNIRRNFGLIVVGIVTPEGGMIFNPAPEHRLEAGSTLIMLGKRRDLERFERAT